MKKAFAKSRRTRTSCRVYDQVLVWIFFTYVSWKATPLAKPLNGSGVVLESEVKAMYLTFCWAHECLIKCGWISVCFIVRRVLCFANVLVCENISTYASAQGSRWLWGWRRVLEANELGFGDSNVVIFEDCITSTCFWNSCVVLFQLLLVLSCNWLF